jgi:methylase of polypeptide subunit release factors
MKVYEPHDDSYLIADVLEKYFDNLESKNISFCDMGCGSAILGGKRGDEISI